MHWRLVTLALILLGFAVISRLHRGDAGSLRRWSSRPRPRRGRRRARARRSRRGGARGRDLRRGDSRGRALLRRVAHRPHRLRRTLHIPARLLGIGLPLTILAGFAIAPSRLPDLAWPEALLGRHRPCADGRSAGPGRRHVQAVAGADPPGLNVEAGLNDGICVPLFLIALAVALAEEGAIGHGHAVAARLREDRVRRRSAGSSPEPSRPQSWSTAPKRRGRRRPGSRSCPSRDRLLAFGLAESLGGSASSPPSSAAPSTAGDPARGEVETLPRSVGKSWAAY